MDRGKYPEVTVGALIFSPKDEIFLMKSHKFRDKYVIPGGHIEFGEKAEDALKREIKEETDLEIYGLNFLQMQECICDNTAFYKSDRHFIFLDYTCRTNSREAKLNDEGQSYVWASLKDALRLDVETYTRRAIKVYLDKK